MSTIILNRCIICNNDNAPYKCPRCHKKYCSLQCYKEHNSNNNKCLEGFYKEQIDEYNEINKPTNNEKKDMEMIIYNEMMTMRNNNNDEEEEEDDDDVEVDNLYKLLDVIKDNEDDDDDNDGILLNLNKYLTNEQIKDFKKELKSGRLYKEYIKSNKDDIIEYKPWWLDKIECNNRYYNNDNNNIKHRCCCCYKSNNGNLNPSSLSSLIVKEDILIYKIVSVVYTYSKLNRQYLGNIWPLWNINEVNNELIKSLYPFSSNNNSDDDDGGNNNNNNNIYYDNIRQMAITMNMYNIELWNDLSIIFSNDEYNGTGLLTIIIEIINILKRDNKNIKEVMALHLLESYIYYHYIKEERKEILILIKAQVDQLINDLIRQQEESKIMEDKILNAKKNKNDNPFIIKDCDNIKNNKIPLIEEVTNNVVT